MADSSSPLKKAPFLRVLPIITPRSSKSSLRPASSPQDPSFYRRWFTKSVLQEPPRPSSDTKAVVLNDASTDSSSHEQASITQPPTDTSRRKFSLLSWGAITVILSFVLIIAIVLATALPITLRHRQSSEPENLPDRTRSDPTLGSSKGGTNASGNPLSPTDLHDPSAYNYSKAPVRLALLTNFPDPTIYYHANTSLWYAFGTNGNAGILNVPPGNPTGPSNIAPHANIQVATSKDFVSWVLHDSKSDPLPDAGAWTQTTSEDINDGADDDVGDDRDPTATAVHSTRANVKATSVPRVKRTDTYNGSPFRKAIVKGTEAGIPVSLAATANVPSANVWAPDVIKHPSEEKWLMYYSAISASDVGKHHCIGASTTDSPVGPYEPNDEPIACPILKGGAIDPVGIVDPADKRIYVVYKIDGNSIGHGGECNNGIAPLKPTPLMLQRMEQNGITRDASFEPLELLDRTKVDGPLIEAPAVVKVGALWFMFYSSGCTRAPSYDVRYATAKNLTGPWERYDKPLFKTGDYGLLAPGSVSVRYAQDDGQDSGVVSDDQPSQTSTTGWKIALHARVRTNKGGVRAVFTAGLQFSDSGTVNIIPGIEGEATTGGCTGGCAS